MPKLSITGVRPLIEQVRSGNYAGISRVNMRTRAEILYRKAIEGMLSGQERLDAYDFYKLSLQLQRSSDPRAILAYAGHELEIRDGFVFARAFDSKPIGRIEYEIPASPNREVSIPLVCRDWVLRVQLQKDKAAEGLREISELLASPEFKGVRMIVPEDAGSNIIKLEVDNGPLSAKLLDRMSTREWFSGVKSYRSYETAEGVDVREARSEAELLKLGFSKQDNFACLEGDYYPGAQRIAFLNRERAFEATADLAVLTDLGTRKVRDHNEDSAGWVKLDEKREAFIVVDGMGGEAAGDVASRLIVDKFLTSVKEKGSVIEAMQEASIYAATNGPKDGGATGVAVLVDKEAKKATIVWVGDSRAKYVSETAEGLLTRDHSQLFEFARGNETVDLSLPLNREKLQQIETALDEINQRFAAENQDYNVRSHGNIVLAAMGGKAGRAKPIMGVVEIPLVESASGSNLLLYSDGLIEGEKKGGVEVEDKVTEIARQELSPRETASVLRDAAFANETTDNVTVIVAKLPGELDLINLVEISSAKYAAELTTRMSEANYRLTLGELRRLVDIYQLNPNMVPREVIEKVKERTRNTSFAEAKKLAEKLGIDLGAVEPVEAKVIVDMGADEKAATQPRISDDEIAEAFGGRPVPIPPPLPPSPPPAQGQEDTTTRDVSDSMIVKPGTNRRYIRMSQGLESVLIFDGNWGGYHEALMQGIAQTVLSTKGKDKVRIYLSHTLMGWLEKLNAKGSPEEKAGFFAALERGIKARKWWTRKDEIYLNLNPSNLALEVLLAKEIAPKDIKVLFASFSNGDSDKK